MVNIVVPGELVSEKPIQMPYAFVENGKTYAAVISLLDDRGGLIPLQGPYDPAPEDLVVGVISDIKSSGYSVDIHSPTPAFLSSKDTRDRFNVGDTVMAPVKSVDEIKHVTLGGGRALGGGHLIFVPAVKIPRVIGKKNSMVDMIEKAAGCKICVGRNGYIWLGKGGNVTLAMKVIEKIIREAHVPGLTDRIDKMLKVI